MWVRLTPGDYVGNAMGMVTESISGDPVTERLSGSHSAVQHCKQSLLIPLKINATPGSANALPCE